MVIIDSTSTSTSIEITNTETDFNSSTTVTVYITKNYYTTDTTYTSTDTDYKYREQRIENIPLIPKEILQNEIDNKNEFDHPFVRIKTIGKKNDNRVFYSIQKNRKNLTRLYIRR